MPANPTPAGPGDGGDGGVLGSFGPLARQWFAASFAAPTPAQAGAWAAISRGQSVLVVAPTGSGKTLAAFLWALDRLATEPAPADPLRRCRVVYVSPLKALAVDVERNLRAPLAGMRGVAARLGAPGPDVRVGVRSGDTPAEERRRFGRTPPDILITTPESLYLILTSAARDALHGVRTVIVDEVHALAGGKRGAHLALSLERLDELLEAPAQRIGLSATVRPVPAVAAFLGGQRPVHVVAPPSEKRLDVRVVVPVADLTDPDATPLRPTRPRAAVQAGGEPSETAADGPVAVVSGARRHASVWPHVAEQVAGLVRAHRSTLVFANSRRLAERLTARLNEIAAEGDTDAEAGGRFEPAPPAQVMAQSGRSLGAGPLLARAHHGSVSKEQRRIVEEELKSGRLPCVVATSSLELGIDMGAVDLVVQVEAPPSVASGLQRIGRAGHQVGAVSRGVVFPRFRGDLLATAVVAERMRAGAIEELHPPANPLDVLAQQVVAAVAVDAWDVDRLFALVRRATPFRTLPRSAFDAVLDLLAGRYPSTEFAELRPRLVWDRATGRLTPRPGAQRLAVTSGGTIPDRGLFGVFLAGSDDAGPAAGPRSAGAGRGPRRVGELDEEMVYESRVGDVFTLGTTSWRIEDITRDRVLVSPAPGQPGRLPFWKGDQPARPAELGRAVGRFVRELAAGSEPAAVERLTTAGLSPWAVDNLRDYLAAQRQATGHLPDDRTIVVERFRDELGDWRVCVHSPLGGAVHAPWALVVAARLRERYGVEVQAVAADDGIVCRVPDTDADPPGAADVLLDPDDVERLVTAEVGGSALFAGRFRECAARALLLPRRDPRRRSPLWQQRMRSAQLLDVVRRYPSFPIVLEAVRECLQDVYDVSGLAQLMAAVAARRVRVVEVETAEPSPFARSLTFGYVGAFLYDGDAPLAEWRATALTLDQSLLAELLGRAELRELLDADVVAELVAELQRRADGYRCRHEEDVADLLRVLGPLTADEVAARCVDPGRAGPALAALAAARRVVGVPVGGQPCWAAVEDVALLRDGLGVPPPPGVAEVFLDPVPDPLAQLLGRYARTHGPFTAAEAAGRFGLAVGVVDSVLRQLEAAGQAVAGEFRPGGAGAEWCDPAVLRTLRRRSLARLRHQIEPVDQQAFARFLPVWQHADGALRGVDGLLRAVEQLAGAAVPASALESLVLPARVADYRPGMLDELTAAGEVCWTGQGALPGADGWVSLHLADAASLTLPEPGPESAGAESGLRELVLATLSGGGAFFFRQLADTVGCTDDAALLDCLWQLVWAGRATNDTLAPLRALLGTGSRATRPRRPPRPRLLTRPRLPIRAGPPAAAGRWSLVAERDPDPTRRAHAAAEQLLDRHGVVTRGAVVAERVAGGFAAVYRVLAGFEAAGRCRRGYVVDGLGAAQFGTAGAVDRLRALAQPGPGGPDAPIVLAAADPANPYGAALAWPEHPGDTAHRPGRSAGALVVLSGGALALYVERGGRSLLTWPVGDAELAAAVVALGDAVRRGALGRLTVERADGSAVHDTPLAAALAAAGFRETPRGLRLSA